MTTVERVGITDLVRRFGLAKTTITRWSKTGRFPAPHYLGELRRWYVHEIEAWERAECDPARPRKRASKKKAEVEAA